MAGQCVLELELKVTAYSTNMMDGALELLTEIDFEIIVSKDMNRTGAGRGEGGGVDVAEHCYIVQQTGETKIDPPN